MPAVDPGGSSRTSREPGAILVPVGITLTLFGVAGGYLSHGSWPGSLDEALVALGAGTGWWPPVVFGGLGTTALGGVRWASRLGSDPGDALGAGILMLVGAAAVLGGWASWQESDAGERAALPVVPAVGAPGVHANHGAAGVDGGTTSAAAPVDAHVPDAGAGGGSAEGVSFHAHAQAGTTTLNQWRSLAAQLDAARRASARYRDIDAARADGFIQVTQFLPGLGLHLAHPGRLSGPFDPARPTCCSMSPPGPDGSIWWGSPIRCPGLTTCRRPGSREARTCGTSTGTCASSRTER